MDTRDEELRRVVVQLAETTVEGFTIMRDGFQQINERFDQMDAKMDERFDDLQTQLDRGINQLTQSILKLRDDGEESGE